jgi:hypothetical protein
MPADNDMYNNIKTNSFFFILFAVLFYYLELIIVISLSYSYSEIIPKALTRVVTLVWLMAPMVLISLLPAVLLFFMIAFLLSLLDNQRQQTVHIEIIIIKIAKLINQINKTDNGKYINLKERKDLAYSIYKISNEIRKIYTKEHAPNKALFWADSQMSKVADSFESLSTLILFPTDNDLSIVTTHMIPYLNGFLTNNYKQLPQELYGDLNSEAFTMKKRWFGNSLIGFISLGVYMISPIFVIGVLVSLFSVQIEPLIQTLLNILYGAWILFGTIYYSERLSPDFRKSLFDLLGAFIPNR